MSAGAHKGRGATISQLSSRFDDYGREADGDWIDESARVDGEPQPIVTQVTVESPRSIIARNTSPDVPFDRSINPYRGCEHGCVYCFARPTHAFHNLSPGLDFETRLFVKPAAAKLLRAELSRRGYAPRVIAMGTNTDPYQPIEERFGLMREILAVLAEFGHPVSILTKSDRIVRDLDLIAPLADRGLITCGLSVTSLDSALARKLEPRATTPSRRLAALSALSKAGVPTLACIAPIIPAVNDQEMEDLVAAVAEAGVVTAAFIPLRLPHEVAPIFKAWLLEHCPQRADHVMSLVRSIRDGRENDPSFGSRMRGSGPYADLLRTRFRIALRRHGLDRKLPELRTDLFAVPGNTQLSLL